MLKESFSLKIYAETFFHEEILSGIVLKSYGREEMRGMEESRLTMNFNC